MSTLDTLAKDVDITSFRDLVPLDNDMDTQCFQLRFITLILLGSLPAIAQALDPSAPCQNIFMNQFLVYSTVCEGQCQQNPLAILQSICFGKFERPIALEVQVNQIPHYYQSGIQNSLLFSRNTFKRICAKRGNTKCTFCKILKAKYHNDK